MTTVPMLHAKETAVAIRAILRAAYPATRFSVVTKRGSMTSAVRVTWTDGPTPARVDALIGGFRAGRFDGMTDSYEHDRTRHLLVNGVHYRPGTEYIFTERHISPTLANRCIAQIAAYWGDVTERPTAVDGYRGFALPDDMYQKPVRPDLDWSRHNWSSSIHRAADDRSEYVRD